MTSFRIPRALRALLVVMPRRSDLTVAGRGFASDGPARGHRDPRRRVHPAGRRRRAAGRDLPEHRPARAVEGRRARLPAGRSDPARGDGVLPPEQEELQDRRQPRRRHVHAAGADPEERRPAGLTITEVSDFTFAFRSPAFLQALARARHHDAGAARERPRHAADAGLVRAAGGIAPDRQGADVLPRERRDQPVREADRRHAGDHGPRRPRGAAGDRHRRRAAAGADPRVRRGDRRARATDCGRR